MQKVCIIIQSDECGGHINGILIYKKALRIVENSISSMECERLWIHSQSHTRMYKRR